MGIGGRLPHVVAKERDQAVALEDAPSGGSGRQLFDAVGEVIEDGLGAAVVAVFDQLGAEFEMSWSRASWLGPRCSKTIASTM